MAYWNLQIHMRYKYYKLTKKFFKNGYVKNQFMQF